jgi:hypothetical protein
VLEQPVHQEKIEHLLLTIAVALTKQTPEKIAYWLAPVNNADTFFASLRNRKNAKRK